MSAIIGVYEHLHANYEAGPLDRRYAKTWSTMSAAARWWVAASKTVGPAPTPVPLALAAVALCLLLSNPSTEARRELTGTSNVR